MAELRPMLLSEIAKRLNGTLIGLDREVGQVTTDTRLMHGGELFIALRGDFHDGHDFISAAQVAGAAAAVVEVRSDEAIAQIVVADSRAAMGSVAALWRDRFTIPLIALTGSNGKTTVKEMIRRICQTQGQVLATPGNFNNEVGVPHTLLLLAPHHEYAVVEMGANHSGEIDYLASLARPAVALVTNASNAHLEGFGSRDAVARAKGEIYQRLDGEGVAVINQDDPYADLWREMAQPHRVVTFAMEQSADVTGRWMSDRRGGVLSVERQGDRFAIHLPLLGRHNAMNALAAIAVGDALGFASDGIRSALESMRPIAGRLQSVRGINGGEIIDDSYNANPASLEAGIEVLAACEGERILVLGDMAELGGEAAELHARVGALARAAGIERLYTAGELSAMAIEQFGHGGERYQDKVTLIEALRGVMEEDVTLLVKGSRSSRMEQVVEALSLEGGG